MKQRFSSLDVRVVAHELSEALVSLRLANIYDLNSKILLLKFAKPDNRQQLMVESGFRCHLTEFVRTASPAPSQFVARLRKYLKTRRCTSVSQIGTDRIIEFQFSDGAFRLYLEFFASGNVILTDSDLKILALLRNVPEGEGQEPQRVGLSYTLENRQNFGGVPALTKERLRDALQSSVQKAADDQAAGKKIKKKGADELRRSLATTITELPPILVEHVFRLTNFNPATKPAEILDDDSLLDKLFDTLQQARDILDEVTDSSVSNGYIIAKPRPGFEDAEVNVDAPPAEKAKNLLYEDFQPFLPKQFEDNKAYRILPFVGYNKTVDEFFSSLEGQRLESKLGEREAAAKRKLEAARMDQAKRIEGLQEMEMLNYRKAATIQANIERVQEAMDAVNGLLQEGMDWVDITKLIEKEQKQGNPVAEIIKLPMKLKESTITLLLGEGVEEVEDEGYDDKMDDEFDYSDDEDVDGTDTKKDKTPINCLEVDINLTLSVWNNAREYYDQKRTAANKAQKTVQQSVIALKNAEQKIAEDLKKGLKQEKPVLQPIRKQMWFEKFIWFISSDGYLVLGGRDAQQNEMLYKRYLRKGDVYVHADVHGAASVIIKNNPKTPDAPIPPSTLAQAGNLSVCCSTAWDSKAGMGAYWVNADQVSKSAPSGEYLPVGSFIVRGKRNLLPPALLTLGFGLLFRVSDDSKSKHIRHKVYDFGEAKGRDRADSVDAESARAESPHEQKPVAGDASESEDEDEGAANQKRRSNPLHSQHAGQHDFVESGAAQDAEPPMEELADLKISKEESVSSPDEDSRPPVEAEPSAEQNEDEEEDNEEDGSDQPSPAMEASAPSTSTAPQKQQPAKKAPAKRGQRGKQKKIAAKYKDQDEEDRALMEELMGVKAARQKAEAEAAAKAKAEAEAAAARERRRQQQERAKKEIAEHEEVRRLMMEEGEDMPLDETEMAMEMAPLETLVGTPLAGDEILEVVPICAPWTALNKVKYKTKLQPGNTKKGKAVKEIVERWRLAGSKKGWIDESSSDPEKIWPREIELIKGLKVEEAFNCVPVSKVTVMQSGGLAGSSSGGGSGKGGGKGGGGGGKGGNARGGKGKKK